MRSPWREREREKGREGGEGEREGGGFIPGHRRPELKCDYTELYLKPHHHQLHALTIPPTDPPP